jgi:SAM-dependent methyltransferase
MHKVVVKVPIYLPDMIYRASRCIKNRTKTAIRRNLRGDRDIEWSWVASQLPNGPGTALDFGNGGSSLGLIASYRNFDVVAVDLNDIDWTYMHPKLRFCRGDILSLDFPLASFDLVINCSTVEHVGLAGRYGVSQDLPDGDLDAMARLRDLMKPGGVMLLTIPIGRDEVFMQLHRVYGKKRLPKLIDNFFLESEVFWAKNDQNKWVVCARNTAMDFPSNALSWNPMKNIYALGGFVLKRP